jgi:hypothetical protein
MPRTTATEPRRRYEIVVAGCLLLGAALFFGWASLHSALRQWQAHYEFVPVLAIVLQSGVESSAAGASSRGQSWRPLVTYQYSFGSSSHEQNRILFMGKGWSDRAAVEDWLVNFPEGATVTAYVNPADSKEAVLDNTAPDNRFLLFLLPLFVAGGLAMFFGFKKRS